ASPHGIECALELLCDIVAHLREADGESKARPAIHRFGAKPNPAFVRQFYLQGKADALLLLVERVDETAAATQVVNTNGCFQGANSEAIEWSRHAIVLTPIGGARGSRSRSNFWLHKRCIRTIAVRLFKVNSSSIKRVKCTPSCAFLHTATRRLKDFCHSDPIQGEFSRPRQCREGSGYEHDE